MIKKCLTWLSEHPGWNAAIAVGYFLLAVLPHEQVGKLMFWLFDSRMTRDDYNLVILAASVAGLAVYVAPLLKNILGKPGLMKLLGLYLAVTVALSALAFKLLIIINIEAVHFVQYGIMALLLFPLVKRYGETAFWATLLGAADEAWQYFYLAPHRTNYYDFNDVIINLLGAAFGLILVRSLEPAFALPPRRNPLRSPVLYTSLTLAGLIFLAFENNWLFLHAPDEGPDALWSLIRVPQSGFWTTVHPNVTFHIVQPLEGLLIVAALLAFYAGLGAGVRTFQKSSACAG